MSITAILNCYRRPQNLAAQLQALSNQTIPPDDIWIWKNYHSDNDVIDFNKLGYKVFNCNFNWKYCGRFAAACLVDTDFTAILDDDTIPGNRWFENCLETFKESPGILGTAGIYLHSNYIYNSHARFGWPSSNPITVEVDLVGHSWFFPANYIKHMWMEKPMWANGEDIHFSAMCQIHGGIKTYAPPHPVNDKSLWGSLYGNELGIDAVATSRVQNHVKFYHERDECLQKLISLGWKLKKDRQ